jgi:threonine/homoserine/homoserine lactone efflux protein
LNPRSKMDDFLPLLGIVGALAVGVVSPGPSFLMVARTAAAASRPDGLRAALGMGLGGLCFGAIALAGLQAVFVAVPSLYAGLKIAGGAYLCYLGWRIFMAAKTPLLVADGTAGPAPRWRYLVLGWTTQLSNPKTAIVYASVFAAFLPPHFSVAFSMLLLVAVFAIEAGWYALVALALSAGGPRRVYLRAKTWLDRAAGGVMAALGGKLLASAWKD